jgi:hypothetical protein
MNVDNIEALPALAYALLTAQYVLNYNGIFILFFCQNKGFLQAVAIGYTLMFFI